MNKISNKYTIQIAELKDSEDFEFEEELKIIRDKGDLELIPELIELIKDEQVSTDRKHKIVELLSDITNSNVREMLIDAIDSLKGTPYLSLLISAMWQSRLDFTPWLDQIVQLMFEADLYTTIEVITLIENSSENLNDSQKHHIRNILQDQIIECKDETRKFLILESLNSFILSND